jgi:hypothetical protein
MSWSVTAVGTPDTIKDSLYKQFAALRNSPELTLVEQELTSCVEGTVGHFVENSDPQRTIVVDVRSVTGVNEFLSVRITAV